ncbi:Formate hydrogenlyase transcriptional activator [Labilithrix luteola]|uniref:Formate hydrogenlyase transcriptional activator n=1 Tax=Labilithrix luteola TaxID=1391654 RepID=A0A0K1PTZ7_9BACT|nr:Formate hydrogenlyase transcriptional activator [Labilithrix luteola]
MALARAREALDAGDFALGRALAEEAVRTADASMKPSRAEARRVLALALLYDDRVEDAQRLADEAIRIARAAGSIKQTALAELALAEVLRTKGDYVLGLKHASRARKLAEREGDPITSTVVLSDYATLLGRLGDDERAREVFDHLVGDGSEDQGAAPLEELPRKEALRVLYNATMTHRAAGRFDLALRILARADALTGGKRTWPIVYARALTLLDMGAYEEVRALLEQTRDEDLRGGWQRAQMITLRANLAMHTGARTEVVEALVTEGLAIEGLTPPLKFGLQRVHAHCLLQKGQYQEAERVGITLMAGAAKGGTRVQAAHSLAIAARGGVSDAWLLRWLGAVACSSGGGAARIEHEALSGLVTEPEPIGQLARNIQATCRARILAHTPPEYRKTMLRTLRLVEQRTAALRLTRREETEAVVTDEIAKVKDEVGIAGGSPAIMRAVSTTARAAKSNANLVLTGETGSGKELFARLAHRLSPGSRNPFVAVNCAAIPQPLLEAELFGHERGAFTGAERSRRGLFVEAEGGTLFLDEVGEMSAAMQAKLLRVLEDGEIRAVGGVKSRKVNVRVVAATHRDLAQMVAERTFREDLYYRLAAITVRIPALRERAEDLPAIARAILAREPATKNHRLDVPGLAVLAEHAWPGNVRELSNVLRVAAAMAEGTVIGRPAMMTALDSSISARGRAKAPTEAGPNLRETTLAALRARHRNEVRELVGRAIASADGNKLKAARSLGVSRQGLYRVLES